MQLLKGVNPNFDKPSKRINKIFLKPQLQKTKRKKLNSFNAIY